MIKKLSEPHTRYCLEEFKQFSDMGKWALCRACKAGLKMLKIGNHKFVKGQAFINFLDSQNTGPTNEEIPEAQDASGPSFSHPALI